jgi:hypothetical protein
MATVSPAGSGSLPPYACALLRRRAAAAAARALGTPAV